MDTTCGLVASIKTTKTKQTQAGITSKTKMGTPTKLRILCLHGFTSNAAVHAHQMRHLVSLLPEYEFLFPDGPHKIDLASTMDMSQPANQAWGEVVSAIGPKAGPRGWWRAKEGTRREEGRFEGDGV
jgi:hypothetical protein